MQTEMQVLEHLKAILPEGLRRHLTDEKVKSEIAEENIRIDFPDPDNMRRDSMIFMVPEYENIEELTTSSDQATFEVKVFMLTRKAGSDVLVKRIFDMYTAFYLFMRNDPTLDGAIDHSRITDMDYYPAVTASGTMVAIEVTVVLEWSKSF